jgi:eukaryotic-like serine/threonine-protein kinase
MTTPDKDKNLEWMNTVRVEDPPAAETSDLPVVSRNLYRIVAEVGKGGIGQVFAAQDERLHRRVALKELHDEGGGSAARFIREAMLTARLQHPNIVPIYEAGRWPSGEAFYAMRLVSGRTLEDVIAEKKSLNERLSLLPHVLAVAEAIAYAHNERIIHRDLKPANIIIGSFGETVVIDWGVAKSLDNDEKPSSDLVTNAPSDDGLTMMGAVMGTPGYMSPEQAEALPVDERTDVYSLGAILYDLLAGVPPYHTLMPLEKLTAVLTVPPTPLTEMVPNIAPDLLAIVQKAMAQEKERRYPSAREFADDLRRFQSGQIVGAHEYSFLDLLGRFVQKHRLVLSVVAGALVILLVIGTLFIRENTLERKRADQKRYEAEQAEHRAKNAEVDSVRRADELTLLHAAKDMDDDPNRVITWLDALSSTFDQYGEMRLIAADARSRGLARILRGHTKLINSLEFFPNGRFVASASDDKSLRLWDLESQQVSVFEGHRDEVWRLTISNDNQHIATTSLDRDVRIWDVGSKKTIHTLSQKYAPEQIAFTASGSLVGLNFRGPTPWIWSGDDQPAQNIAEGGRRWAGVLAGDGSRIAGIDIDGTIWTVVPRDNQKETIAQLKPTTTLAPRIFVNSRFVVTMQWESGKLLVWDAESHKHSEFETPHPQMINADFVGNGQELVAAFQNGAIQWWNLATHTLLKSFNETTTTIQRVVGSPDGRYVAFGNLDRTVRIRSKDDSDTMTFYGFAESPTALRFSPDGRTLAAGCINGEIRLFSMLRPDQRVAFTGPRNERQQVAISPKDDRAWGVDAAGRLRSWNLRDGALSWTKFVGTEPISTPKEADRTRSSLDALKLRSAEPFFKLIVAPSGNKFVVAPLVSNLIMPMGKHDSTLVNHTLRVLNDTGEQVVSIPITVPIIHIAFAAGEKQLVTAEHDGNIVLYDLAQGRREKVLFHHEGVATGLDVSPDGNKIVSVGGDGVVCLIDLVTGQTRVLHKHEGPALIVKFAPEGNRIASGGSDHKILIHDLTTSERITIQSVDMVDKLFFSPDGSTLAHAPLTGNVIELSNARTGEVLRTLRGHPQDIGKLQFTRDGTQLVSSSNDGTLRIWNVSTGTSRVLSGHEGAIYSFDLTSDGRTIISSAADGTVRMYRDDLPEEPAALRAWIHAQATNEITMRQDTPAKP